MNEKLIVVTEAQVEELEAGEFEKFAKMMIDLGQSIAFKGYRVTALLGPYQKPDTLEFLLVAKLEEKKP